MKAGLQIRLKPEMMSASTSEDRFQFHLLKTPRNVKAERDRYFNSYLQTTNLPIV